MPIRNAPSPPRRPTGAGAPIVLALMAGTVIGYMMRQPTIGFLAGAAIGITIALTIWWRERG